MSKYFYAPIFSQIDEGQTEPSLSPGYNLQSGELVNAVPLFVSGVSAPECDRSANQRFVMVTPDDFETPDGWTEKTKEQVNTDYPGLLP